MEMRFRSRGADVDTRDGQRVDSAEKFPSCGRRGQPFCAFSLPSGRQRKGIEWLLCALYLKLKTGHMSGLSFYLARNIEKFCEAEGRRTSPGMDCPQR